MCWRRSSSFWASRLRPLSRPPPSSLGVAHAVGCSSGTDALWLALAAAGIGPGDAVVTTPFSFFASVSAILRAGATPLLADIDPATFNLDPTAVEARARWAAGGKRVRAILPVHLYGQTATGRLLRSLGQERGLKLIEDAAQAWGAEWNGVKAGGLGDAAAFSFYPTKNLSAAGDAGMVTTNSDELAERLRCCASTACAAATTTTRWAGMRGMDGFQGAILGVKLKYIDGMEPGAARGGASATMRCFALRGWRRRALTPATASCCRTRSQGSRHVWHQYVIRTARRDALREFLAARKIGIGDLLPGAAAYAGGAEEPGLCGRQTFLKPSARRAKCWRCRSSRNCARTSSRPWSMRLRSF